MAYYQMDKKLDSIIKRFILLYPEDSGISVDELYELSQLLDVEIPQEFSTISTIYSGGIIGNTSIFDFNGNEEYSIYRQTLKLRQCINLPHDFLVLYCEYGMIYMDCNPASEKYGHVMYVSPEDAQCLGDGITPEYYFDFPSFADFFEHLLDEEEKLRAEENGE